MRSVLLCFMNLKDIGVKERERKREQEKEREQTRYRLKLKIGSVQSSELGPGQRATSVPWAAHYSPPVPRSSDWTCHHHAQTPSPWWHVVMAICLFVYEPCNPRWDSSTRGEDTEKVKHTQTIVVVFCCFILYTLYSSTPFTLQINQSRIADQLVSYCRWIGRERQTERQRERQRWRERHGDTGQTKKK